MLRRIGVLGDIHTEDAHLATALRWFGTRELDAILSVGDLLDGHGDADETLFMLRQHNVLTVTGNHDRWFLGDQRRDLAVITSDLSDEHRAWLAALPATRRFETPQGGLLLCHGIGEDDMAVLRSDTDAHTLKWLEALHTLRADETLQFMIGGHTHERMVRHFDDLTVINAGTLHREYVPGFIEVDFEAALVRGFDLDDGRVREAERYPLLS